MLLTQGYRRVIFRLRDSAASGIRIVPRDTSLRRETATFWNGKYRRELILSAGGSKRWSWRGGLGLAWLSLGFKSWLGSSVSTETLPLAEKS